MTEKGQGADMKNKSRIYTLQDPRDLQVRLVGCSRLAAARLINYNPAYKATNPLTVWRKELHDNGLRPMLTLVCEVSDANWRSELVRWTELMRQAGATLFENRWCDPTYTGPERANVAELKATIVQLRAELAAR